MNLNLTKGTIYIHKPSKRRYMVDVNRPRQHACEMYEINQTNEAQQHLLVTHEMIESEMEVEQ